MPSEVSLAPLPVTADVPPELDRECLERIRRILAGQEPPPVMTPPAEVVEFATLHAPRFSQLTPEGQRFVLENFSLQYLYGGNEVLTWQSPEGLVVFAVDMEPVARVLNHLSQEEMFQVLIRFPPPWW